MNKQIKENLFVLFLYTIITLLQTYPLLLHFNSYFIGQGDDLYHNIWNFWHFKNSFLQMSNPFFTHYLYYPMGANLIFQTMPFFHQIFSLFFSLFLNWEAVYNLNVIFTFVFSGWGMYLLAKDVVQNQLAAFVSGTIFAFCPYRMGHSLGHLNLISNQWLPFFALYLFRGLKGEKKAIWLAGFFLFISALSVWYYLIYLGIFAFLFLLFNFSGSMASIKNTAKNFLQIFLFGFFLLSPILLPSIYYLLKKEFLSDYSPGVFCADLLSFFVPGEISRYGNFFHSIWNKFTGNISENQNYLGYVTIILSFIGWRKNRQANFWIFSGIVFFILALGPTLHILGKTQFGLLPYQLIEHYLPFFSFGRVPERFTVMVYLSLAILAGFGLKKIKKKFRFLPYLSICLLLIEYSAIPYPLTKAEVLSFYFQMAKDKQDYAIVDIPSNGQTLYFQTVHHKRLIGGYVSRYPKRGVEFLQTTPVIMTLKANIPTPTGKKKLEDIGQEIFQRYNIKYIITHTDQYQNFIENGLRLPLVYQEKTMKVYRTKNEG